MTDVRNALRAHLTVAMKAHEADTVSALRTAIAAIDNAESVDPTGITETEVSRRVLSPADVRDVLSTLVRDYRTEADDYEHLGQSAAAARLRRQAIVVSQHL